MSGASQASERAAAFLDAHADELEARIAAVLVAERPLSDGLVALDALQQPDGGFSQRPGGPAGVAATLRGLGLLDDLRALDAPSAERACGWLERAQARDGSWGEGPTQERVFATGMLAGHLAKTRCVRPHTLESAGAYLARHWAPERVQGPDWPAIAAFAHFFANAPHELADQALQWCGRELERGFRTRCFDAVRTARVFAYCDAHALPGARIDAAELVCSLLSEQVADGSWRPAGDRSAQARVTHTLDALVALVRLG